MAKHFSNSTETRDELSTTCKTKIKVLSRCLSAPDATSLHYCFQNHCQYFTILIPPNPLMEEDNLPWISYSR